MLPLYASRPLHCQKGSNERYTRYPESRPFPLIGRKTYLSVLYEREGATPISLYLQRCLQTIIRVKCNITTLISPASTTNPLKIQSIIDEWMTISSLGVSAISYAVDESTSMFEAFCNDFKLSVPKESITTLGFLPCTPPISYPISALMFLNTQTDIPEFMKNLELIIDRENRDIQQETMNQNDFLLKFHTSEMLSCGSVGKHVDAEAESMMGMFLLQELNEKLIIDVSMLKTCGATFEPLVFDLNFHDMTKSVSAEAPFLRWTKTVAHEHIFDPDLIQPNLFPGRKENEESILTEENFCESNGLLLDDTAQIESLLAEQSQLIQETINSFNKGTTDLEIFNLESLPCNGLSSLFDSAHIIRHEGHWLLKFSKFTWNRNVGHITPKTPRRLTLSSENEQARSLGYLKHLCDVHSNQQMLPIQPIFRARNPSWRTSILSSPIMQMTRLNSSFLKYLPGLPRKDGNVEYDENEYLLFLSSTENTNGIKAESKSVPELVDISLLPPISTSSESYEGALDICNSAPSSEELVPTTISRVVTPEKITLSKRSEPKLLFESEETFQRDLRLDMHQTENLPAISLKGSDTAKATRLIKQDIVSFPGDNAGICKSRLTSEQLHTKRLLQEDQQVSFINNESEVLTMTHSSFLQGRNTAIDSNTAVSQKSFAPPFKRPRQQLEDSHSNLVDAYFQLYTQGKLPVTGSDEGQSMISQKTISTPQRVVAERSTDHSTAVSEQLPMASGRAESISDQDIPAAGKVIGQNSTYYNKKSFSLPVDFEQKDIRDLQGLVIFISESRIEESPDILAFLKATYEIRCIDFQFYDACDIIISPLTCLVICSIERIFNDTNYRRDKIKSLSDLAFRYPNIWFILTVEGDVAQESYNDNLLSLYSAFVKFPCKVIIREVLNDAQNLAKSVAYACFYELQSALTRPLWTPNRFKQRSYVNILLDDNASALCDFFQHFPTINLYLAVLLVSKWTIPEIVHVSRKQIKEYLATQCPHVDMLEEIIISFMITFHAKF